MGNPVTAAQIYPALKALLGLPEHITQFELRVNSNEIVTVACEYYPYLDGVGIAQLVRVFGEYELVRRPAADLYDGIFADAEGKLATDIGFDAWMRRRTERAHAEFMTRTAAL